MPFKCDYFLHLIIQYDLLAELSKNCFRRAKICYTPTGSPEQKFVVAVAVPVYRRNLKPNPRRIPPSSNYEIQLFLNFNSPSASLSPPAITSSIAKIELIDDEHGMASTRMPDC